MTAPPKRSLLSFLAFSIRGDQPLLIRANEFRRAVFRSDEHLRDQYLRLVEKPKLHIGSGLRRLDGWLNTDIDLIPDVMHMDATEQFPFADNTFEYVFTEHMIEHVPHLKGMRMLHECYRVLRHGGVIRVITPDLATIIGLYARDQRPDQREYLQWFSRAFLLDGGAPNAVLAINAMFRLWGHQFLYDETTLTNSMTEAGFRGVQRHNLGESSHLELQNLENEQRYPKGMLNFESLALEGLK
jgi:predicted SAM-dependent methyltransferase